VGSIAVAIFHFLLTRPRYGLTQVKFADRETNPEALRLRQARNEYALRSKARAPTPADSRNASANRRNRGAERVKVLNAAKPTPLIINREGGEDETPCASGIATLICAAQGYNWLSSLRLGDQVHARLPVGARIFWRSRRRC